MIYVITTNKNCLGSSFNYLLSIICIELSAYLSLCKDVESPHLGLIRSLYRAVSKDLEYYVGRIGRETLYMVVDK
jgi:hypothetical protein